MRPAEVLWSSIANVVHADREIAALRRSLEEGLGTMRSVYRWDAAGVEGSLGSEPDHWVDTCWYMVYELRRPPTRGRAPSLGTLTVAYSLWRQEDEVDGSWIGARQAKLYVGFDPNRFTAEWYWRDDLCLDGSGRPTNKNIVAVAPCLWEHDPPSSDKPYSRRSWFFCVPLDALNSPEDLSREVLEPLDRLLEGASPEETFAETTGVFRVTAEP